MFFIFFLGIAACSQQPALNSERIADRYGNYGIEVLKAGHERRVSDLYSSDDGNRTTRTLAIVRFTTPVDSRIAELHRKIQAGASIGATFKTAGWRIGKETLEICLTNPSDSYMTPLSGMHLEGNPQLAVHRYRFTLRRRGERINYAVITEIHHPDYLGVADLRKIFVGDAGDYVQTDQGCVVRR